MSIIDIFLKMRKLKKNYELKLELKKSKANVEIEKKRECEKYQPHKIKKLQNPLIVSEKWKMLVLINQFLNIMKCL